MDLSYILNELGEDHGAYFNAVAPPIMQTSNFILPTVDALRAAFANEHESILYSRGHNPTVNILRKKLAALDGAEDCLVFNSGASAIFCSVLPFVKQGSHIVSVGHPYTWAKKMFDVILPRFGVSTTYIDGTQIENWVRATQANTTVYYLESPNSWTYELQDLAAVAALARGHQIKTIVDNSYCTPIYQQPISLGIDLCLQSATKYLGGHSDVVAGVLTGSRADIKKIFDSEYMTTGAGCTPFHAWLLLRGLRTLPLRLQRVHDSTQTVFAWLKQQPWVDQIIFSGSEDFPQRALAKQQMKGSLGLLTLSVKVNGLQQLEDFCSNLKVFKMAVSWGGHESLIIPKCATMPKERFNVQLTGHRQIRFYIALEDPQYLIQDLQQAAIQSNLLSATGR